jgi:peroxiredoxin
MKTIKSMIILFAMMSNSALFAGGYQVGDKAQDFKLQNIDGKWVSLSDFKSAKGFIIIFTCNHCPYAKAYEERIIALDKKYGPMGYPVIAINPNDPVAYPEDSYENMQKRAKDKGFTFPYLFDEQQTVFPQFGAVRTPHIYILSKKGSDMMVEYIGAIDDNYEDASKVTIRYAENTVDALLAGKKPELTMTKAVGCSIKVRQQ